MADTREHFSQAQQQGWHLIAGNDQRHGQDDDADPQYFAWCEPFVEEEQAEEEGRKRLQRSENGRGGGTDVLNGRRGAEEGDGGREESQCHEVEPKVPMFRCLDGHAEIEPEEKEQQPEQEDVEGELKGGNGLEGGAVDPDDVDGIGECRPDGKERTGQAQRCAIGSFVEQTDADECHQNAERGLPGDALAEEEGHENSHDDWIDEENRAGDAGSHVVETFEQTERREGHEQAQKGQRQELAALDAQSVSASYEHCANNQNGKQIAKKEDRIGSHAVVVERQCKEGTHAVGGRGKCAEEISFCFGVHDFDG